MTALTIGSWVCLLAPLAGALAIALAGTRISRRAAGLLSTGSVVVAFGGALAAFVALLAREGEERVLESSAYTWLEGGRFEVGLELLVDPLSVVMMLVVSGVGSLIVGYSIGYMHGDDEERRYFAYMALFVFSMLLLVQAGNFLLLLVGWGLVGLASYLLIGFWHQRESAVAAAKKAFVMNAFGDATMALALFLLIWNVGTLDFAPAFAAADELSGTVATLVALGLLGGAVAKSAQIPLHTWLPDAMEGPTPVSALIHAATMVTAGVYLLVRTHAIFEAAELVQDAAAVLGAVTLVVAGLVALVQTDIKRVIAYSTMSQIGYMFLGAGIGAYANAMFHLMTHAFFKALLFLGAGVVIHALAGEQDIHRMGGLKRLMPRTYWAMLVGALALAGIFPLSGFWSKDSILATALAEGSTLSLSLLAAGLVGAFLTALYTFRMIYLVFHGEPSAYAREHHHRTPSGAEGPLSMTAPVAVLVVLSIVGGWIQMAGIWTPFEDFLHAVAEPAAPHPEVWQDVVVSVIAVGLGLAGIAIAWAFWGRRRAVPRRPLLERVLQHKLYFDEAYDWAFYRPAVATSRAWARFVEGPVVGGAGLGLARGTRELGEGLGAAQTGLLRTYVLPIAAGAAIIALVFVSVR